MRHARPQTLIFRYPCVSPDWVFPYCLLPVPCSLFNANYQVMETLGIHHVAIICSDYEKSKKFYVELLGFPIIAETFRKARNSYKLDLQVSPGTQIELFSFPNPPKRVNTPEACGLRHLAFAVKNIEQSVAYLKSKGISVEDIRVDELTGKRFTFFSDPDGLPLEIYEN